MIDTIYQIVKTVLNKELRGNVTPDEFNKIAKQVQDNIFEGYFGDTNTNKNKQNRGLTNKGFANLAQIDRQKITQFAVPSTTLTYASPNFTLPTDLYYLNDNGLMYLTNVIEEAEGGLGYLSSSLAAPSTTFPVYEDFKGYIKVYPATIVASVTASYLRKPLDPKWTYTVASGIELYDNTIGDHQDFELHSSELPTIVIEMLSYFGVNLRESDVAKYAEALKRVVEAKKQQL